ncbi:MAG: dipeptidase [Anaeroplasmataceae bacterium]|nr:dipeptidase [Anaeroplasmataceae bacterium]
MNYIDLHCDTISIIYSNDNNLSLRNCDCQINLEKLKKGHCLLQCFAMFIHLKKVANPFITCMAMIDRYYQELKENEDLIAPVFCFNDIEKNTLNNKISSLLTIEEGAATLGSLEQLRNFYRLGVRMICLSWNFENGISYPNVYYGKNNLEPNTSLGLTVVGRKIVKEMNRLGIIIDVSHLSDKGFYEVLSLTTKPIVASHSNARSICPHLRNLTDDMIIKLAANGGVMGINFYEFFLDETSGKETIKWAIKHMIHVKNLVGVDVLAIGTDFDGIDKDIEIKDAAFIPNLWVEMRKAGFTEEEIKKIAYQNFLRVLKANLE